MSRMQKSTRSKDPVFAQRRAVRQPYVGLMSLALLVGLALIAGACTTTNGRGGEAAQSPVDPAPTMPTATIAISVGSEPAVVARLAPGDNRYFISGPPVARYQVGDLLVVYAQDVGGFAYDAAVVFVVDRNEGNLIVQVIFENEAVTIDSLAALSVDDRLADVNLAQMVPISLIFVGFMLDENTVRLVRNVVITEGDELEAVQLATGGDALSFADGPVLLQVASVGVGGAVARVTALTTVPPAGTLLIQRLSVAPLATAPPAPIIVGTPEPAPELVRGPTLRRDLCVQAGETVTIQATGEIDSGIPIGLTPPEGKSVYTAEDSGLGLELVGIEIEIPIDDDAWNKIPQFPHGTLLYRIEGEETWRGYHAGQQFIADRAGCLEFDVNAKEGFVVAGGFEVQVNVQR